MKFKENWESQGLGPRRGHLIARWGFRFLGTVGSLALLAAPGMSETPELIEGSVVASSDDSLLGSVAGNPPAPGHYLLASSTRCHPNDFDNCQIINAVLRYNAAAGPTYGKYDGTHVENIDDPQCMVIHPVRRTLLVASRGDSTVYEYNRNTGALIDTFISPGSEGLYKPQSIVFIPNGNVLVSSIYDQFNPDKVNGILEFDGTTGAFVRYFIDGGSLFTCNADNFPPTFPMNQCVQGVAGMVMGANGNLYFVSSFNNRIYEVNPNTAAYVGHFSAAKMVSPNGIAIRPPGTTNAGNVLVTSLYMANGTDAHKVVEFNGATRLLVTTGGGVFFNGLENPGPLLWENNNVLLISDRLHWRVLSSAYSDRIRRHAAIGGLPCTNATCEPDAPAPQNSNFLPWSTASSERPLHFCTGMLIVDVGCANDLDCYDNNPCTDDICNVGTQACSNPPNNSVDPDDGLFCNGVEDRCENGAIVYSSPVPNCSDNRTCTTDRCLEGPSSHICENTLQADQCLISGVCVGAGGVNGANGCQECDPTQSTSAWINSELGTPCGDQVASDCDHPNTCNGSGVCRSNIEPAGTPCGSNLTDACTNPDTCDGAGTCRANNNPDGTTCNDGLACTPTDRCALGFCVGTGNRCPSPSAPFCIESGGTFVCGACRVDTDCFDNPARCTSVRCLTDVFTCFEFANDENCPDPLFCDGVDFCNGASGLCEDPGASPCPNKICDEVNDRCVDCTVNADCNDGVFCNGTEVCVSGSCQGGSPVNCSGLNSACQVGSCNETEDRCVAIPGNEGGICDDGNQCTTTDRCENGACVGSGAPPQCDDGNPCTTDSCDPVLGCRHLNNTAPCNDNNPCTSNDQCSGGLCTGGTPTVCEDNNPCTNNSCHPLLGCQFTARTGACDDGNICTINDLCFAGQCIGGSFRDCSDGNVCTTDTCSPALGCQQANNNESCNDGNGCTTGDTCSNGACVGGPPPNCDDNNPCTNDSCSGGSCQHSNNAAGCNDGNLCTTNDVCGGGTCGGTPVSCPPFSFCDPMDGVCKQCGPGVPCNDGNPCTSDVCNSGVCQFTNNSGSCNDGNACTTADICSGGSCVGTPVNCQPGFSCDPADGLCKDCLSASECNDGNACTTDTCVNGSCQNANNTASCNDNNPCTSNDRCGGGVCVGTPISCPGGQTCDPSDGACKVCFNDAMCNDNDACTADRCASNVCLHDRPPNQCDDSNACTVDSCNPLNAQCGHAPRGCVYGDVAPATHDCTVTLNDVLCVVDGFARRGACQRADIFPCGGSGDVTFDDVLAILKTFEGDPACPDPATCP